MDKYSKPYMKRYFVRKTQNEALISSILRMSSVTKDKPNVAAHSQSLTEWLVMLTFYHLVMDKQKIKNVLVTFQ